MLRVIVRCLLISLLLAVPAAAAFAAGIAGIDQIFSAGNRRAAIAVGAVIALSAFVSSLLASWWNGGAAAAAAAVAGAAPGTAGPDQGVVKWFNVAKGFGFITLDSGGDIFVHFRDIRGEGHRSLTSGQRVAFAVKQTDKGPQAHDVTVIGGD